MTKNEVAEVNDALFELLRDIDKTIDLPKHLQNRVDEFIKHDDEMRTGIKD
jgi:hypothetical protein